MTELRFIWKKMDGEGKVMFVTSVEEFLLAGNHNWGSKEEAMRHWTSSHSPLSVKQSEHGAVEFYFYGDGEDLEEHTQAILAYRKSVSDKNVDSTITSLVKN